MRRQGLVWLSAAVLALGAAACFSDPTKSLRAGATRLALAQQTLLLHTGDSASIQALVYDDQGNPLTMTGAVWSSVDATIASVRPDTANPIPGDAFARGVVKGVAAGGGVTRVVLTLGSLTDTLRVTVLPAAFPGVVSVIGTPGADTIIAPPAPTVIINAGDTLVLNSSALMTFSATASTVSFGPDAGYIVARSATQIKAMSRRGYQGAVTVTNVTFAGDATTGPIAVASINTGTVSIQHARFRGAIGVASSAFGPNTQITVTAPAGATFSGTAKIVLGASSAIILTRSASSLSGILAANYTGSVMVTGTIVGLATTDSLRTTGALTTVNASFFPGTVSNSTGHLLDTIVVRGNGAATFTTAGASASQVSVGTLPNATSPTAFVIQRTADSMKVIAKIGSAASISISNVVVSGVTISSLSTQAAVNVSTAVTGEANEPTNNSSLTPTALAFTGAADTITVYGSIDCEDDGTTCPGNGDKVDFYSFTTSATQSLRAILTWFGNGAAGNPPYGSDKSNPDLDVIICNNTGTCGYSADLTAGSGAGLDQPTTASTTTTQVAGTYRVGVYGYVTPSPITYQLKILRF